MRLTGRIFKASSSNMKVTRDTKNSKIFIGSVSGTDDRDRKWDSNREKKNIAYCNNWYFYDESESDFYGPFRLRGECLDAWRYTQ